ncbi:hypothetical protein [Aequorivita capsosiphonis]|uniref:hypothetical protein n=1 Tax=Aequorivita capsosiphonis TaxID=487317 RepID=UPI0003F5861A|nr:hypothetical protein [Aequorivita capsosiphonis]
MKNSFLIFSILFVSTLANAQDLNEIRAEYPQAVESSEITTKLDVDLANVNATDNPVLVAYKGAILTLTAKFSKGIKHKKEFFKEGVSLIEAAVKADDTNIEIRYLRLSVQENSPKFLGYHEDIEEDKEFILMNYAAVNSKDLKNVIKGFALNSENFNESERAKLN